MPLAAKCFLGLRSLSCILLVSASTLEAFAAEERPALEQVTRKPSVTQWTHRAVQYAQQLNEKEFYQTLPFLWEALLAADQWESIQGSGHLIKDQDRRAQARIRFCLALANSGRFDSAIRAAIMVPENRKRDPSGRMIHGNKTDVLLHIAYVQTRSRDFRGARETMKSIRDLDALCIAWCHLAENQAVAGQYDDAAMSLEKAVPANAENKKLKEKASQFVSQCKAELRKTPSWRCPQGILAGWESTATTFTTYDVNFDELLTAEKKTKCLLIVALVHLGYVDGTAAMIEKMPEDEDILWYSWAVTCASKSKNARDIVKRKLQTLDDNKVRLILCAGAAVGLNEKLLKQFARRP